MLRALTTVAGLALTLITSNALASEPTEEPVSSESKTEEAKPHDDLVLTGGAGVFGGARKAGGAVSLMALRQKGWLGYGGTFEYGTALFDYTTVTAAPMVGLFIPAPRGVRAGIAVAGGVHTYSGVERGFISSSDPGASGTTAFVGTRLILGGELGGKARFHLGLQLSADDDLARLHKTYSYEESAFTTSHEATATHTVGELRFGAMVAIGGAFDL